ncbi:hypothetical protein [Bosea sp. NPDC055594]
MTVSTKENLLAVDLELIARLKEVGSWCGETHVQKSMFLLSTVLDSDLGYEFIIYKHGPFSFDFRDDLIALQSIGAVKLNTTVPGYGPSFEISDFANKIREKNKEFIKRHLKSIDFIVKKFGKNDVKFLEKITTAIYIAKNASSESESSWVAKMHELKPHIPFKECEAAVNSAQIYLSEVKQFRK